MKYIKFVFLVVMIFSFLLLSFNNSYAQVEKGSKDTCPTGEVCITNPLGEIDSPQKFIGQIINGILGIVGSLALAMFIYGGFLWMTSAGNAEQVTKGKNVLVWATLGMVIIFSSYALVRFVIYDLVGAPTEQT